MLIAKSSVLSRLDRHLMAGTAAAVAVGAGAVDADAAIVYSGPQNIALNTTNSTGFYLDLVTGQTYNAGGPSGSGPTAVPGTDINIYHYSTLPGIVAAAPVGGDIVARIIGSYAYADRLASGATIDASSFSAIGGGTMIYGNPPISPATSWLTNTSGYLGLQFVNEAGPTTHFGWIQVAVGDVVGGKRELTIIDWAFESTPNAAIAAGAVPEPASAGLALLALGALGTRAWRRKAVA